MEPCDDQNATECKRPAQGPSPDALAAIAEARALAAGGDPEAAYRVLVDIPDASLTDPDLVMTVEAEKQLALLEWDAQAGSADRLQRFHAVQRCFYHVTSAAPDLYPAYQCQAEFWRRLGDVPMARRLLQSVHTAFPTDEVARHLASFPESASPVAGESGPDIDLPLPPLRVLFLTDARRPHYGLDVLYDGFRTVLGPRGVTEYPWKATLHGCREGAQNNSYERYPCLFNHPADPVDPDGVVARIEAGDYDCVLYGDMNHSIAPEALARIARAARSLPLFVVDQEDDPCNNAPAVEAYLTGLLGGERWPVSAYFKRETLACSDYGADTYPLPFAFPEARISRAPTAGRSRALFWAGHRQYGLRRLYLDDVERRFGLDLREVFLPDDYARAMEASRLGLCIFGVGFDTIRYWELPAHGCLLVAERPPIRIPGNFVDGESAVLFDSLADLREKVPYYLAHEDEAVRVAERGREHLRRHHSSEVRARQLLAWMRPYL